ncbi:TPA: RHS repeat-associated core domain-containing protein, partial [Stenotrophomonas maltophilia]
DGTTGTPIETYAYDATGNRTALTTSAGTANYTYPATSHRLTAVDGEARNHDAVGNTTSIGGKTFTYNDANRMNAVKQGYAVLESYAYNHRGERVLRTPASGAAQITLYDEAGQWLGNYSATGQAQQQAIWLDNYPVALINMPATGVPELAYVQPDHLGTPRVVIDPVRDVAIWEWSNKSEVFGNQIPSADPDGDGVAFELALRFPGQQATAASGLFYNYQREYDPAVGRYSQSDPIGLDGGINTYAYAEGDPLSYVDPLGLQSVGPTGAYIGGEPRASDACMDAAILDSALNLTPGVGTLKAFTEGASSLDSMSAVMSTTAAATEVHTQRADAASNARIQELNRWGRNRKEQASLRTAIQANKGLNQLLRVVGRNLGLLSVGVETIKFSQAAEECMCKAK